MRTKFARKRRAGTLSPIVIRRINWKDKKLDFFIKFKDAAINERGFSLGSNKTFTTPDSKYDIVASSDKDRVLISIIENGNTLKEKIVDFATKKIQ
jgi:hypothetical protein